MSNNQKNGQRERQPVQQLTPDAQAASMTQGYNLGFTVDYLIKTMPKESRDELLETLSSRRNQEMFGFFVNYLANGFIQAASVDNIRAEMFEHIRIQTVAINTFLGRLAEHGNAYGAGKHREAFADLYPIQAEAEAEKPIDNAPKDGKKPAGPSTETL